MNIEDLDRMLAKNNLDDCVSFFAGASEADRKTLSKRCLQWYEMAESSRVVKLSTVSSFLAANVTLPKRVTKALELIKRKDDTLPERARDPKTIEIAALSVVATCGITEVRPIGLKSLPHTLAIVRDRKPRWLDKWMDFACEEQPQGTWNHVRTLEKEGLATAERNSSYWKSMALTLGQLDAEQLIAQLRADRELLDVLLWQMLACDDAVRGLVDPHSIFKEPSFNLWDGTTDSWKAYSQNLQNAAAAATIWKIALAELAARGDLDKGRLLDVLFNWIARIAADGESKPVLGGARPVSWFQQIIDELLPNLEQRESMSGRFIGLLATKDSTTLCWSLQYLCECDPRALPLPDLMGNISNVFFIKRKEPALAAVKLLDSLIKTFPDNEQLAISLCDAFEHSSNEVHKRALTVIKKYKLNERFSISEHLNDRMSGASVLVREAAKELSVGEIQASPTVPDNNLEQLLVRAKDIAEPLRSAVELSSAIEACENGEMPRALRLESSSIPRLNPEAAIEPIKSLDDLVFLLAEVLEGTVSSEKIEQVLDGMLRCCDQRPEDFPQRVSAVRKRIAAMLGENSEGAVFGSAFAAISTTQDVAAVARAWIDQPKFSASEFLNPLFRAVSTGIATAVSSDPAALEFFSERARAISQLVSKRIALPLLSAPTHKGGWIDPRVLPDRIQKWNRAGVKLERTDVIQALLRLAPEYREEALHKVRSEVGAGEDPGAPKRDEYVRGLIWALGGPQEGPLSSPELWIAAFRCREPRGSSDDLARRFPGLGPDSAVTGGYDERLKEFKDRSTSIYGTAFGFEKKSLVLSANPKVKQRANLKWFPTELLHTDAIAWMGSGCLELYWPLNRESFYALEVRRMALHLESQGQYWLGSWDPLFDPNEPLCGYGSWLIALGMAAKQLEISRLAVDALITGIDDARIDSTTFGTILGKLFLTDKITLSRWVNALKDVSRISPFHAFFVFKTIEQFLITSNSGIEGLTKAIPPSMLELMYDCCSAAPYRVESQSAREVLSRVEGKGKAAKLAKLLMEPPKGNSAELIKQFSLQVLSCRIDRAVRWHSQASPETREVSTYALSSN